MEGLERTARTTLGRKRDRGFYELDVALAILDEGLVCHVGFAPGEAGGMRAAAEPGVAGGSVAPIVLPTAYARVGEALYLHGARGNRMLGELAAGAEVCVTVTLLDGLVLARSAFRHSMNYRSVLLFGRASEVVDEVEKRAALTALVDHMVPGRGADARGPDARELESTLVVKLPITEGSVKVRTGGPNDLAHDLEGDVWAGVIPMRLVAEAAAPADDLPEPLATQPPPYVLEPFRAGTEWRAAPGPTAP